MNDERRDLGCLLTDGLDSHDVLLLTRAFTALWHGAAPTPVELAGDTDPTEAAEVLRRLAAVGRCEVDDDGRIVGAHGITRKPTRHQIVHARGRHHTWCGFDAVAIPAALGLDATATTECPHCATPMTVRIAGGVPADDGAMVVWLPTDPGEHLIADFCSQSNVFCSADHLEHWLGGRPRNGQVVTVPGAAELGHETWAGVTDATAAGERRGDGGRPAPPSELRSPVPDRPR